MSETEFNVGDKVRPRLSEVGLGNYFTGVDYYTRPEVTVTGTSRGSNGRQIVYFEPLISRGGSDGTGNAFSRRMELVERAPSDNVVPNRLVPGPADAVPFATIAMGDVQPEVTEPKDLTEFKLHLWREAQDIKEDWGYESVIDDILQSLGVTEEAVALPSEEKTELDDFEVGTIVPVGPREPQNFFLKTSEGWRIVWPEQTNWDTVMPGGGVEQLLKDAIKEKENQNA